jgi:hypothetical protein
MKNIKQAIRYWFLGASLASFLGGWLLLAHAPKPIQPQHNSNFSLSSFLGLPSQPGFGFENEGGHRSRTNLNAPRARVSSGFPLLRTGGS